MQHPLPAAAGTNFVGRGDRSVGIVRVLTKGYGVFVGLCIILRESQKHTVCYPQFAKKHHKSFS
jgi:hypothetical protein